MARSEEYPDLEFVRPRSWTRGRKRGMPRVIVVHYTAGHEGPNAGEAGAAYDARRTDGTSAHYHADSDTCTQCVYTWDEAHTARSHGNDIGIQYELAGTVQTRAQWLDPVSRATIRVAAKQMARDCKKYGIPVRRLSVPELRSAHPDFGNRDIRGFVGHVDCTYAYPEDRGDHMDPGKEFPWDVLFADVNEFLKGEEMAFIDEEYPGDWTDPDGGDRKPWQHVRDTAQAVYLNPVVPLVRLLTKMESDIEALRARPAATVTLTAEDRAALVAALGPIVQKAAEDAVRRVLGTLDGATPNS